MLHGWVTRPGFLLTVLCAARRLFTKDAGQLLSKTVPFSKLSLTKFCRREEGKHGTNALTLKELYRFCATDFARFENLCFWNEQICFGVINF